MKEQQFFAQKAFIIKGNSLLVIQKSEDDPNQPLKWEVPGGRIKFGESLDAHIAREVEEETGVKILRGDVFYLWEWQLSRISQGEEVKMHVIAAAAICPYQTGEITSEFQESDDFIKQIVWKDISEVGDLDWIENMKPVVEAFLKKYKTK